MNGHENVVKVLLAANADIEAKNDVSRILCVYMCPKLCWCLFVCFEYLIKDFLFFIFFFFICSKRKEILSNFLFSVFLFLLFLMMANDFFS